jgi:hypothetical protein
MGAVHPGHPRLVEHPNPDPTALRQLVAAIARRWQTLDADTGSAHQAPWGYLVGVGSCGDPAGPPASWPRPHVWQPGQPRTGFTVLRHHPAVALRGFVTPSHWQAVGVAVHGVARRVGAACTGRAAVVWLCHRNGSAASWLLLPGDQPVITVSTPADATHRPDHDGHGVVAGLLRRSLHRQM